MQKKDLQKLNIPNHPGVYFFKKGNKIIYIGKATSLRSRIKSYFSDKIISSRGPIIVDMVTVSDNISFEETDNVLTALILEANLIKKYQPKYNTKEKDNKSWNYLCINKEEIPKVVLVRGKNLNKNEYQSVFGPFVSGNLLKEAMKIIRPIFPYFDEDSLKKSNREFYKQIGLVPIDEYKNNIKNLKLFFQGKKKKILLNLKKEMFLYAKKKEFEKANEIKKKIFAINHINDISLIKIEEDTNGKDNIRIESYDIAHMFGKNMVGVMVVLQNGLLKKSDYKKFIIKTQNKPNDIGALKEIVSRRFNHPEWGLPSLIVVDGNDMQINAVKSILALNKLNIPVVSVVKNEKHKPKYILGDNNFISKYKKEILLSNNEAHRFAINFHKNKRAKNFLNML